jgi:hypothetical protein
MAQQNEHHVRKRSQNLEYEKLVIHHHHHHHLSLPFNSMVFIIGVDG